MMPLERVNEEKGREEKRGGGGVGNLALKLKTRFPSKQASSPPLPQTKIIAMMKVLDLVGHLEQACKTGVLFGVHLYET